MLISKEFTFTAAHKLAGNTGEPLHSHKYKARVTCSGDPNREGKVQDTRMMSEVINDLILKKLDHAFLNDYIPQPTMENLAVYIWDELVDLRLQEVRIWENDTSFVTYTGK